MGKEVTDWQQLKEEVTLLRGRIVARQKLYPFEEVLELVNRIPAQTTLHLVTRHKKYFEEKAKSEFDGFILSPHYSFSYLDGIISRHTENANNLPLLVATLKQEQMPTVEIENVLVFFEDNQFRSFFRELAALVSQHFHISTYDDILHSAARKYRYYFANQAPKARIPSIEHFFDFLRSHFAVDGCLFQSANLNTVEPILGPELARSTAFGPELAAAAQFTVRAKRKSFATFQHEGQRIHYCILPIRGLIPTQSDINGAIALISKEPIPLLCEYFVRDTIDDIFAKRLAVARGQMITDMMSRIAEYSRRSNTTWSVAEREAAFRRFSRVLIEQLFETTSAHSCTLRVYDHVQQTLTLVALKEKEGAQYDRVRPKHSTASRRRSIPITKPYKSLNAFCFDTCREGNYIYLKDVASIPKEMLALGLVSVAHTRSKTVSEFTLPIYWGHLRIGVINLEADFPSAFELDETFIKTAAFLASQAWGAIFAGTDRHWLSQVSFTHLATHELADFRRSLEPRQTQRFDQIVYTLSFSELLVKHKRETLFDVQLFAQDRIRSLSPEADPEKVIAWPTESRLVSLTPSFAASLRVIFESIIRNAHKHSILTEDRLVTEVVGVPGARRIEIIIIYESCKARADPDEAKFFFYQPLQDSDGLHFGLFLVGAHVRLLGGHTIVDKRCLKDVGYPPLRFCIRIPQRGG